MNRASLYSHRQRRIRVLDALEQRIKQFVRRDELWPLRVPHEPLPLEPIIDQALAGEPRGIEPLDLRSRLLMHLEWDDGSTWDAWVIVLPSGLKLYCDSILEESRVLASGGRNEGDGADRVFLDLLAESAGAHFGIEMSGGPPARVRAPVADRQFLIDFFVNLFEVTGSESSVRDQLASRRAPAPDRAGAGHDFRADVERWLDLATASRVS